MKTCKAPSKPLPTVSISYASRNKGAAMTDAILALVSAIGNIAPNAAMKAIEVPSALPVEPSSYWPWIFFGALVLALFYVFQR